MARIRRLKPYQLQAVTALHLTTKPTVILPFMDDFDRADGALGNGWTSPTWLIGGNKIANDLVSGASELFTNPGCEGTYTAGLAPNWTKNGGTHTTATEEGTIIHGGAKAQKCVGDTTNNKGVNPNDVTVTANHWYLFDGWLRNEGPGDVYVYKTQARLANISNSIAPTGGVYKRVLTYDKAASTGNESIDANQKGTVSTTWYVDDWSLKEFTYPSFFATRPYLATNFICKAAVTYVYPGEAGIVVNLDDPANPQNYILAEVRKEGTIISLYKVLNQTRTLIVSDTITPVAGESIEIRKIGTTYRLYYCSRQLGADVTVSDAAIINNHYVGIFAYGASTIDLFSIRKYGWPLPYTPPDYSSYYANEHYTAGQGIVSLRFDDTDYRNYTIIYPLLATRSLVAGFSIVRSMIGYTNNMTLAQLLEMQTAGMEIMCHSMTHAFAPDWVTFIEETEAALMEMRLLGLNTCTFITPGSWTAVIPDYVIDDVSDYGNSVDTFLRRWFKYYTASVDNPGAFSRTLPRPSNLTWGAGYNSLGSLSLATWQNYVDLCATHGYGMDVLMHVQHLDEVDYISTADFEAALDYLAAAVTAGTIVVKTPTAQLFATPS
jgi:peptidoglycan/xylan/chitin deacetylase (PgdA/CDA1 family)